MVKALYVPYHGEKQRLIYSHLNWTPKSIQKCLLSAMSQNMMNRFYSLKDMVGTGQYGT